MLNICLLFLLRKVILGHPCPGQDLSAKEGDIEKLFPPFALYLTFS